MCEIVAGKGYRIISSRTPGEKSAIVCVSHADGLAAEDIAARLERENIIVSPRNGRLRIAPHFYNNPEDIERLCNALP
jgi:selenocysteine lyase/cysteine desulfurase